MKPNKQKKPCKQLPLKKDKGEKIHFHNFKVTCDYGCCKICDCGEGWGHEPHDPKATKLKKLKG